MATRQMDAELFGREATIEYSEAWVGYSLLGLRLVMGWTFLYAGIEKLLQGDWGVEGFLLHGVPEANPFTGLWAVMATDPWAWWLTGLNMYGQILIGLALILGAFVRWSALWGAVMMLFYWLASFPLEHALVVDDHVVYALLLFGLGAFGAGRILGLDRRLEGTDVVGEHPRLRYLLG